MRRIFRIFKKPPYYCTHRDDDDNQFWECTYTTRAGKEYKHTNEPPVKTQKEWIEFVRQLGETHGEI